MSGTSPRSGFGRICQTLSLALGIAYLAALPAYPYTAAPIVKGLSIAVLAVLPWLSKAPRRDAGLLSAALAASAVGDVLLDVDPARLFVAGLGAFLAAHIIYTVLFAANRRSPQSLGRAHRIALAAVLVYVVLFSLWLAPGLGELKIPVAFYICAITAMAASALGSRYGPRMAAGALLFVASDSLLAIAKFKTVFPARGYAVWATYYAAQYLISTDVVRVKSSA